MLETLDLIRMADRLAAHAGAQTAITAGNVANANTPGFRAKELPGFAEVLATDPTAMRATRPGHLAPFASDRAEPRPEDARGEASANGNTVSLEREMVNAAAAREQHEMALAIRSATNNVIRASLGRNG